jgi:hypothetical protein
VSVESLSLHAAQSAAVVALTRQQTIEVFPKDTAPPFTLRDRDGVYSCEFKQVA